MLKRIFVFVLIGALFVVGVQFASVIFYLWQFDDFVNDEVKFVSVRENDSKEHLVEHIMEQARAYHLDLDPKDIRVEKHSDLDLGITTLSVDLNCSAPVDLYYFTSQVRRHVHATTTY
jgi:hypothetical protein